MIFSGGFTSTVIPKQFKTEIVLCKSSSYVKGEAKNSICNNLATFLPFNFSSNPTFSLYIEIMIVYIRNSDLMN